MFASKTREITFIYNEELDFDFELLSSSYKRRWAAIWALGTLLKMARERHGMTFKNDGVYRVTSYGTLSQVHYQFHRLD